MTHDPAWWEEMNRKCQELTPQEIAGMNGRDFIPEVKPRSELMPSEDSVVLDVAMVRQERPKAVQVILRDGRIFWLPRSMVEPDCHAGERDFALTVPGWLWENKLAEG